MTNDGAFDLRVDLQGPDRGWISVGRLARSNERTTFVSFEQYWRQAHRPILGQVFEQRGPSWRPSASVALPTWFSNLLPEGILRRAIAQSAHVAEAREFHLLARIGGDDLPGAVRVVPIPRGEDASEFEEPDELTDSASSVPQSLKFSLAGVQLKFSVADHDRGLTVPARGDAGTWIAKLPDRRAGFDGVPESEFAAMEFARESGVDVPVTRLVDINAITGLPDWAVRGGGMALLVERFDRRSGARVHVEELAQVLDIRPSRKYQRANVETVARAVAALDAPEAVGEVIDRVVVNVLVGNGDAHTKNWAFTYPDGRNARLSPAYDIVPTVLYLPDDDLGLNLNGSRRFEDVGLDSFEQLAAKAGWDGGLGRQRAVAAVERALQAWPVLVENLAADAAAELTRRRDTLRKLLP